MFNIIIWLIAGAVIGGLATFIIRVRGQRDLLINVAAGMAGAVLAGYLVTPMFHIPAFKQAYFSFEAFLIAIGGSILLVFVVYLFRKKRVITDKALGSGWAKARTKIHVRWDRLTEEDVDQINGDHKKFIRMLQERYGIDEKKAEEDLQNYLNAVV